MTFATAGVYSYTVKGTNAAGIGKPSVAKTITVSATTSVEPPPVVGGACPSTYQVPANTTIVKMGGRDNLAKIEFNQSFDTPGNKIDSRSDAGQIKAWEFNNNTFKSGNINGNAGNFGAGYKDWSVSACPGDFNPANPKCRKIRTTGLTLSYHASDETLGCVVPPNQTMYLNIRANDPALPAGYVVGNVPTATLP